MGIISITETAFFVDPAAEITTPASVVNSKKGMLFHFVRLPLKGPPSLTLHFLQH